MKAMDVKHKGSQAKKRTEFRTPVIHKYDMRINKDKLEYYMKEKGYSFVDLHNLICERYGLDLKYKGLMSLVYNLSSWKLIYVHVIQEILEVPYTEFFEMVKVDVEGMKREKEEFKKKYYREE